MFDSLFGRSQRAFFLLVAFVAAVGLAGCSSDDENRLLNGVVVANDLADLTDGTLDSGISADENGDPVMAGFAVWTGTDSNGLRAANHCNDWTGGVGQVAQFGFTGSTDAEWTNRVDNATCAAGVSSSIYCFAASAI